CLKLLGQALAAHGIAALRFDKRGAGESLSASPPEADLRIETYVADAVEWGNQLRQDRRFTKIAIIGHNEGSLVGMLAAKRTPLDAFVSLEGAGRNIADVLRQQLKIKLTPELNEKVDQILQNLAAGKMVSEVPPELVTLFRPSVQPFYVSWMHYDPA